MAKFSAPSDSYDISRAEHAAMSLARACGLDVPDLDLRLVGGRAVYLIKRFDRAGSNRLPFVSALTLLAAHEIAAGEYSYADVAAQLRKHGSAPARDLRELFRRMVFNVLVGNSDDHLRNHGVIYDGKGWHLSPLYDVVPTPQLGTDRYLVLALGSGGKRATLANALSGHAAFGLPFEQAAHEIERLRRQVAAEWPSALAASGLSSEDRTRLARCFAASGDDGWMSD
ncbi:type II toxin-antitoxin system HipA family toxin [Glacieibacterium megasporae]|uniref:type II toxin-antitoxin system HipA family toxin n=1 Tax=Glacieibacterium megasporae TaxID=2835787 RepID=UPI0021063B19|nr:HipA domain-containing protein [Polymorphobacter megasporae]